MSPVASEQGGLRFALRPCSDRGSLNEGTVGAARHLLSVNLDVGCRDGHLLPIRLAGPDLVEEHGAYGRNDTVPAPDESLTAQSAQSQVAVLFCRVRSTPRLPLWPSADSETVADGPLLVSWYMKPSIVCVLPDPARRQTFSGG